MENYEDNIGLNIRQVRLKRGLSQRILADKCGFSNTTLSNYETGKKTPSLQSIAKIAKQLGVTIDRLYYGDEAESFITAEPDIGRKVVNAVYYLWEQGVISLFFRNQELSPDCGHGFNCVVLYIHKYEEQIERLIKGLEEYKKKKSTYDDPDGYREMLLSSVANEINRKEQKN